LCLESRGIFEEQATCVRDNCIQAVQFGIRCPDVDSV